jgi:cytochrome c biogenesis protein CcmG/thiol:disulfide interchange protein DsbE
MGLSDQDLKQGNISIVNFWASWCGPCKIEHPQLVALAARDGFRLIGINYKDELEDARAFLDEFGDPFERIGVDEAGRVGIDWGLTGVPETFVVDGAGRIVMKHIGPLTPEDVEKELLPTLSNTAH